MRRRGWALIEVLVGVIILGIVMAALFQIYKNVFKANNYSTGLSQSQQEAQQMTITLANAFRAATLCASTDSGCVVGANAQDATTTSCTIYSRDGSGNIVKTNYAVNSGNFQTTVGSGTATTVYPNTSIALTYYNSTTYNTSSLTTFTPTNTTIVNLLAVGIVATVTLNGVTSTYTTFVGLRNRL